MKERPKSTEPMGSATRGAHGWSPHGPTMGLSIPPASVRTDSAPKMRVRLHPRSSCMGTRNTLVAKTALPTLNAPLTAAAKTMTQP